eukprot:s503_g35.t1
MAMAPVPAPMVAVPVPAPAPAPPPFEAEGKPGEMLLNAGGHCVEVLVRADSNSRSIQLSLGSEGMKSPGEGSQGTFQLSPKSIYSEGSSRSNLEKLKVPWEARSGTSVADFDDLAPTNDYTMDEELGVGGFGTVYRGTKKTSGKEVAIKIIKRERLHSEDNFKEELKVARKLQHPNIVLLHASYQDRQVLSLASKLPSTRDDLVGIVAVVSIFWADLSSIVMVALKLPLVQPSTDFSLPHVMPNRHRAQALASLCFIPLFACPVHKDTSISDASIGAMAYSRTIASSSVQYYLLRLGHTSLLLALPADFLPIYIVFNYFFCFSKFNSDLWTMG